MGCEEIFKGCIYILSNKNPEQMMVDINMKHIKKIKKILRIWILADMNYDEFTSMENSDL